MPTVHLKAPGFQFHQILFMTTRKAKLFNSFLYLLNGLTFWIRRH